jgi:hypothetical protein
MSKYWYVDTQELLDVPKDGPQFVAWLNRGSINNPHGAPHVDVINGKEVQIRAMTLAPLEKFVKNLYARAPYIKTREIVEHRSGE